MSQRDVSSTRPKDAIYSSIVFGEADPPGFLARFNATLTTMHWKIAALSLVVTISAMAKTAKHPFTFEDMMKLKRLSEPVPSPDGK